MVIAIDGPAGSGKSALAKMLSKNTGIRYINSGNIYRSITFGLFMRFHTNFLPFLDTAHEKIIEVAREFSITISDNTIMLDGVVIKDKDIRSDIINAHVAKLSAILEIREVVNALLHRLSKDKDIIVEGRDMCTVVFPSAEVKIYLDASIDARALRRYKEGNSSLSLPDIRSSIEQRDKIDREKPAGALRVDPEANYIDTSDLTLTQVYEMVIGMVRDQ